MSTVSEKTKEGILLEERFIQIISEDIKSLDDYSMLDEGKKSKISALLKIMSDDSARHEKILQSIHEKY